MASTVEHGGSMSKSVAERQTRSHNWREHFSRHSFLLPRIAGTEQEREWLAHYLEMTEGVGRLLP